MDKDETVEWKSNTSRHLSPEETLNNGGVCRKISDSNENNVQSEETNKLKDNSTLIKGNLGNREALRLNNNTAGHGHDLNSCEFCTLTTDKMSGKCFPSTVEQNITLNSNSEDANGTVNPMLRSFSASLIHRQRYEGNSEGYDVKINNTDEERGASCSESSHLNLNNIVSEMGSSNSSSLPVKPYKPENRNRSNYNISVPSTSGYNGHCSSESSLEKECQEGKIDKSLKPNRKRTHRPRKKNTNLKEFDSSSDTGNDDYSLGSEDGCIYTYRGGEHSAEFSLSMGQASKANSHLPAPPLFGIRPEPLPDVRASGASSPDMDYLEMDFDPGPSCEVDTNDESSFDLDLDALSAQGRNIQENEFPPEEPVRSPLLVKIKSPSNIELCELFECKSANENTIHRNEIYNIQDVNLHLPSTSQQCVQEVSNEMDHSNICTPVVPVLQEEPSNDIPVYSLKGSLIPHTTVNGDVIYVRRTGFNNWPSQWEFDYNQDTSGDLISPGDRCEGDVQEPSVSGYSEFSRNACTGDQAISMDANRVNLSSALFHCTMAKKLVVQKPNATFLEEPDNSNVDGVPGDEFGSPASAPVPRCMLWSEGDACAKQLTQIGSTTSGVRALVNTLMALEQPIDMDVITASMESRSNISAEVGLARYLLSHSVAGYLAGSPGRGGLRGGIHAATNGDVSTRFFPTWPERCFSLSHWLAYWITLGAVPIATLNLQATVSDPAKIPDSWHHQMIFGVSPRGVFLSNPLKCVSEGALWAGLCSDSVLLVRRKVVINRWHQNTDLTPILTVPGDERWASMNVLGQIVSMMREENSSFSGSRSQSTHLRIPVRYRAGITIAARTGSDAHSRLIKAPELPLYIPDDNVK